MYIPIPKNHTSYLLIKPLLEIYKEGGRKRQFSSFNMIHSPPLLLEKNEMRAFALEEKIFACLKVLIRGVIQKIV